MTSRKADMLRDLPLQDGTLHLREWTRQDMDLLAGWPEYPFPYEAFTFSFSSKNPQERDAVFRARQEDDHRICLVVDCEAAQAIGYIALLDIDWHARAVGNIGFRIHPEWCDRGIGTAALKTAARWAFEREFDVIRLDVAASNTRALRCYEKVGFMKIGKIWRDAPDLSGVGLADPKYDFLRPHVDLRGGTPSLRFWLMELRRL